MEYFLVFVAGMAAAMLLLRWAINRAIDRMLERMTQEDGADTVTADAEKMELRVEFDHNIYFCYSVTDGAFVCQGRDIQEIVKNFALRYPDKQAAIFDGDESAVVTLKQQMEQISENTSSIRRTS
jgi:hypothetical protein